MTNAKPEYDTHEYFCQAAKVWESYFADKIGRAKREEMLADLRRRYLPPRR
jgi:hypothetical protein